MVSAHAYPTFELSDAVPLLAKTAAKERKLGQCPEIPYRPEIPSLTLASPTPGKRVIITRRSGIDH